VENSGGVTVDYEAEKLKIQRMQMYLQFVSVLSSCVLLYVLISGRAKTNPYTIEDDQDFSGDE